MLEPAWVQMVVHLHLALKKIIGQVKDNTWFDLEVDQESLSGTFNYSDPNYNFLGNSIVYSLSSEKNDKPDQGYETQ